MYHLGACSSASVKRISSDLPHHHMRSVVAPGTDRRYPQYGVEPWFNLETFIFTLFRTRVSTLLSRCRRFSGEGAGYRIATKTLLETAFTEALPIKSKALTKWRELAPD